MYMDTFEEHTELETMGHCCYPRADDYTQQIYIPIGYEGGVLVVSWKDNSLTIQRILKCVGVCWSVAVLSPHELCACDQTKGHVIVVRVTDDSVTGKLEKPAQVEGAGPVAIAVLKSTILVRYGAHLVVYENGVSSPGTMVTFPKVLSPLSGMSSDGVSTFFFCNHGKNVSILDAKGKLCDNIDIDTDSRVFDCTVGDGKLWVGCTNGEILVMSPE